MNKEKELGRSHLKLKDAVKINKSVIEAEVPTTVML